MEPLFEFHAALAGHTPNVHTRFLMHRIHWGQRMLAIKGPRGSGKTTLMLQYLVYHLKKPMNQALYVTADHHWFYTHTLADTAAEFYRNGGRHLFIDEVHKYPRWSRELKNIYDGFPDMNVVFSSSSALDIYRGEADLSRRVITYELPGLSFREYLSMAGLGTFETLRLEDIRQHHMELANEISLKIQPIPAFKNYLHVGYLPLFIESTPQEIPIRLHQTINAIIETDLTSINGYNPGTAFKVKKLLGAIAESAPFKPNVAALARKLDVSRDSIYTWFTHLENARLLNLLTAEGKGISLLQKPEKVYLENTNLMYAIKEHLETGALRETFLLNQLVNAGQNVTYPATGDFLAQGIHIEVGGRNKQSRQVRDKPDYLIASDDLEIGFGNKVPLWLFGLLY
jgi:uncharacterized protein